ncbi:hypothetical protein G5B40_09095 [Pikeienuella piscinae]|uniref:Uncharacterized protein n=1 Tax=Pikeienuella piscinae TaxID=2748098 RepID=A0A7L5BYK4_9RHOB|nr:hypothetical protein [Pikeienuella piscinae]QIE55597.1 hypothetical protein G5B40_09095 [Pikeienuella piscinae]
MRFLIPSIAAVALALPTTPIMTNFTAAVALTAPLVLTMSAEPAEARGGRGGGRGGGARGGGRGGGARAGGGHRGGGAVRSGGRQNVHKNANRGGNRNANANHNRNNNTNRNRNNNVNRNVNRDIDRSRHVDIDVDHHYRGGGWGYGAGGFVAGVATAVTIGAIVSTLPPNCTTYTYSGIGYRECGGTWYQPQYSGSNVTYIVVNDPR